MTRISGERLAEAHGLAQRATGEGAVFLNQLLAEVDRRRDEVEYHRAKDAELYLLASTVHDFREGLMELRDAVLDKCGPS